MSTEVKKELMASMFGVFNKKAEDVTFKKEDESSGGSFFKPSPKDCANQIFRGVVKFIPNLHDLDNMTVTKISYWVPEGKDQGFRYDSPKSVGKYENCIVANKYWELKGSEDARLKMLAGRINYSKNTFALVQVIKDLHKPENDGKIMLWDLPVDIQKKVNALMYPSKEDVEMGAVANNIFDPVNGQCMTLKIGIKQVTDEKTGKVSEYRDYTECNFSDKLPTTMIMPGEKAQSIVATEPEAIVSQQTIMIDAILAGPNLQDYAFKTPTDEILKRVTNALNALTGSTDVAPAAEQSKGVEPEKPAAEPAKESEPAKGVEPEKPAAEPAKTAPADDKTEAEKELLKSLGFDSAE